MGSSMKLNHFSVSSKQFLGAIKKLLASSINYSRHWKKDVVYKVSVLEIQNLLWNASIKYIYTLYAQRGNLI